MNVSFPSKAINVDHLPLARSRNEGFFVARNRVGFAFSQWPPDNRMCLVILLSFYYFGQGLKVRNWQLSDVKLFANCKGLYLQISAAKGFDEEIMIGGVRIEISSHIFTLFKTSVEI